MVLRNLRRILKADGIVVRVIKYGPRAASCALVLLRIMRWRTRRDASVLLIATPSHTNLGDHAIACAEKCLLEDLGLRGRVMELQRFQYECLRTLLPALVRENALIVIDGGGNVGTLWPEEDAKMRDIIMRFPHNPIVVFPQTVYFSNDAQGCASRKEFAGAYSCRSNVTFMCRDRASFKAVRTLTPDLRCLLVPDIVTYLGSVGDIATLRSDVLLCLRDDLERELSDADRLAIVDAVSACNEPIRLTTTHAKKRVGPLKRRQALARKWAEFSSAKLVITDRLHGMVFAALTSTPCLALDNSSHKVSAGAEWLRHLPYVHVCRDVAELGSLVPEWLAMGPQRYDGSPLAPYHRLMGEEVLCALGEEADRT